MGDRRAMEFQRKERRKNQQQKRRKNQQREQRKDRRRERKTAEDRLEEYFMPDRAGDLERKSQLGSQETPLPNPQDAGSLENLHRIHGPPMLPIQQQ